MIFVIIVIFVALMVGMFVWGHFNPYADAPAILGALVCGMLVVCVIIAIWLGVCYSGRIILDDKIELYRTENEKIEQQMSALVSEYMEYEAGTFENLKGEDAVTLINLYPDLKSSELVAKQLEIYVSNNDKIKKLECDKLQIRVYAFWLFFGNK